MKNYLFGFFVFFLPASLFCTTNSLPTGLDEIHLEEDDLSRIDVLIQIHQENLEKEKAIKVLLTEYKALEKACMRSTGKVEDITRLTQVAGKLYTNIQDAYLEEYFLPQFMEELKKFAGIGEKKRIPPVK